MPATLSFSRTGGRLWAALHEDGRVVELRPSVDDDPPAERIVVARVLGVTSSPCAAFVDLGGGRQGWLPDPERPLREGESLPVQVTVPARRGKRATVSDRLEVRGRFLVHPLHPARRAISRRVREPAERQRLENVLADLPPPEAGFVARTAAASGAEADVRREAARLVALGNEVARRARTGAPRLVLEESGPLERALRDAPPSGALDEIVVDDPADRQAALAYLIDTEPALATRLRLALPPGSLWETAGLAEALEQALAHEVALPSGGRLTIEQTEALLSIDVDSGASGRAEEVVRKANLEAADEIPRQLRLRGAGGVVVVDWIGFEDRAERQQVLARFEERLRRDPARTRVVGVSEIGLLQLTRERTGSCLDVLLTPCARCGGRGRLRDPDRAP